MEGEANWQVIVGEIAYKAPGLATPLCRVIHQPLAE